MGDGWALGAVGFDTDTGRLPAGDSASPMSRASIQAIRAFANLS